MSVVDESTQTTSRRGFDWRLFLQRFGPLFALIILVTFTAIKSDRFLTAENITNILRQNSAIGILALGMTFVIILGGIDLSVGALVALAGGAGIWTMNTAYQSTSIIRNAAENAGMYGGDSGFRVWLAHQFQTMGLAGNAGGSLALGLSTIAIVGLLGGLYNGLLITQGRIAPFIATLGTMASFRSVGISSVDAGEFRPDAAFTTFDRIGTGGVSLPFCQVREGVPLQIGWPVIIFGVLLVGMWVVLRRTRYGRYVIAIGCNEDAARYSAINVNGIKLMTYILMGLLTGIAALLQASRFNSVASSNAGNLFELDAIAAVVVGGTSMKGGSGTIFGTVIGVLILGVAGNMMIHLDISPYLQGLIKGQILIGAALLQRDRAHR